MEKEKIKYIPTTDRNVKCSYCGKQAQFYSDDTFSKAYCSKKCEKSHSIALDKIKKNMKWFYIGIVISVLLLLSGAVWNFPIDKKYITGGGMALLGITLILFPFCTPEAYEKYGYIKTTKIGRGLGLLAELLGILILLVG